MQNRLDRELTKEQQREQHEFAEELTAELKRRAIFEVDRSEMINEIEKMFKEE